MSMMKLVEECAGIGELMREGAVLRRVRYRVNRYQWTLASGLPVPGRHRIEGIIDGDPERGTADLIGLPLTLKLEDGRTLPVTVENAEGRLLTEGHGLRGGCSCC
jgi:hypothetical protein